MFMSREGPWMSWLMVKETCEHLANAVEGIVCEHWGKDRICTSMI